MMSGALDGVGLCSRKLHLDKLNDDTREALKDVIQRSLDSRPNTYAIAYDIAWRIMFGRIVKVSNGRGGTRNSQDYLNELRMRRRAYLNSMTLPREIREETEFLIEKFESWKRGFRPGRYPGLECVKK
jgi:hypothetical protein